MRFVLHLFQDLFKFRRGAEQTSPREELPGGVGYETSQVLKAEVLVEE